MTQGEGDETLFVPFNEDRIRTIRNGGAKSLAVGLLFWVGGWWAAKAIFALDVANSAAHLRLIALALCLVALGPLFAFISTLGLAYAAQCASGKRPALAIAPKGLLIGSVYGSPVFVFWSEIGAIEKKLLLSDDRTPFELWIVPRNAEKLRRRFGLVQWYLSSTSGRFEIRVGALGLPWSDIAPALDRFTKLNVPGLFPPKTLAEFREQFQRAPLGTWTTSVAFVSPGDSDVWLCSDGTGGVSGAGILEGWIELEWRERGDWSIDIRKSEEGAPWIAYEYVLFEAGDEIKIAFSEIDPNEWIPGLEQNFAYDGPCRMDR